MKKLLRFINSYKLHHFVFWVMYYLVWVQVYRSFYSELVHLIIVTGIYAVAHATMFYTTQYLLIPQYLRRKRILTFVLILLGLFVGVTSVMFIGIILVIREFITPPMDFPLLNLGLNLAFSNVFMTSALLSIKALLDYIRNERTEEKKEKEQLETELQYLKAQVNPHFLFNTINSVYVLINQNPKKASETLIKLSDLLRAQLYEFSVSKISIDQEINYLQNYIELERLRKSEHLLFNMKIEPGVRGFEIAPLILIPFLENCFKHVSAKPGEKSRIDVNIGLDKKYLHTRFFNTLDPEANNKQNQQGGIGLKNVRHRLELLYPGAYNLEIKQNTESFEVNLTLQVNEY